jgi:hypothetical protein
MLTPARKAGNFLASAGPRTAALARRKEALPLDNSAVY